MAGYREIPVENISTLQDLSGSIAIPWDSYNPQDGNLYLTPDLEAEDMPTFTIGTDYNPHDYSRSLNLKFKPILTQPHLGSVHMPQIRVTQSSSRLE